MTSKPIWYSPGFSFACQRCGKCCGGQPGYVWATAEEVRRIADFLGRKDGWLGPEHVRREGFAYSITERTDGDCVFLHRDAEGKALCSIYPVRPNQCRTWPFWEDNLTDKRAWLWGTRRCSGVRCDKEEGVFYPVVQIQAQSAASSPSTPQDQWFGET